MRRIFKDEAHERLFRRDSCLLLGGLDAATVARVEEFYRAHCDRDVTGIHTTLELESPVLKAKLDRFLAQVFDQYLSRYFDNYRSISNSFLTKRGGPEGVVKPHQDWTFVNEAEYTSLNLFVALCDTDAGNGALGVVKGSHRLRSNIRGTNLFTNLSLPDDYEKYVTFFHMKAGEVFVFSHRTLHASGPNTSGRPRTMAVMCAIPAEAQPLHYVGDKPRSSRVLRFEVDNAFFHHYRLDRAAYGNPSVNHTVPAEGYPCREIEYAPISLDERDILRLSEPWGVAALRQVKERLKTRLALR